MLFREQSRKNEHFSKEVFAKELKKLVALEETRPRKERCWRFPYLKNVGIILKRSMESRLLSPDSLALAWQL